MTIIGIKLANELEQPRLKLRSVPYRDGWGDGLSRGQSERNNPYPFESWKAEEWTNGFYAARTMIDVEEARGR